MPAIVVVGMQWGDEGKGRIISLLAQQADLVVRYNGGNNAGHTVVIGSELFRLSLVPSGIFYKNVTSVIADGVVVDPQVLVEEIEELQRRGVKVADNLKISGNAHVILPYHRLLDVLEDERRGKGKLGTTGRGIGPVYVDKVGRMGIRIDDLIDVQEFRNKLEASLAFKNLVLQRIYGHVGLDLDQVFSEYKVYGEKIKGFVTDTSLIINQAAAKGKRVLFEGAQGTFLDLDHGTYPYVTSSHPVAGGACLGTGIGPTQIDEVIGVAKAYTTRVGEGPFPTELKDEIGDKIREKGVEFGTVTRRSRRCGWLDAVLLRFAARVNGLSSLAVTKLDVLTGLDVLKICIAYKYDDQMLNEFSTDLKVLERCVPIYEELEGWQEDISSIKEFDNLPAAAKRYVKRIAELVDTKIAMISVGRERNQAVVLEEIF